MKIKKEHIIYIICIVLLMIVLVNEVLDISKNLKNFNIEKEVVIEGEVTKNEVDSIQRSMARKYQSETYVEKSNNPYIPNGFKYVEGDVSQGYVIEDEKQNQFVWVPCSGNQNEKNYIKKYYFLNEDASGYLLETYDDLANEFLESIYTYGGFYVGRYETGIENNEPVIKMDKVIYNEINYSEAKEIAETMYEENNDIKSSIFNMYAYDIAANWCIESNNLTDLQIGKFLRERSEDEKYHTGKFKTNNIYDLIDNIWEISTEKYYRFKVCRGIEYSEKPEGTRYPVSEEFVSENLGFRVILYKKSLTN